MVEQGFETALKLKSVELGNISLELPGNIEVSRPFVEPVIIPQNAKTNARLVHEFNLSASRIKASRNCRKKQ